MKQLDKVLITLHQFFPKNTGKYKKKNTQHTKIQNTKFFKVLYTPNSIMLNNFFSSHEAIRQSPNHFTPISPQKYRKIQKNTQHTKIQNTNFFKSALNT